MNESGSGSYKKLTDKQSPETLKFQGESDFSLAQKAARGDMEAFQEIYNRAQSPGLFIVFKNDSKCQ